MKLFELNHTILFEKRFREISKDLTDHIDKLEADAKEVNLGVVKLLVNKANKVLDALHDALKGGKSIRDLDEQIAKSTKQLLFFKGRFESFKKQWKDNEFEADTMEQAIDILDDLIKRIDLTVDGAEEKMKELIRKIAKETSDEVNAQNRKQRKVPSGYAQDMKTHKGFIAKNKK